jgi:hypothetical protein
MDDSKAETIRRLYWTPSTRCSIRDYTAAECFWSPNYIQHVAHIEPDREGLFNLIKSIPPTLRYEPGVIVAEGDFVVIHGGAQEKLFAAKFLFDMELAACQR